MPEQIFETTDLALAAFCKSKGLVLADLRKNDRGIVTFNDRLLNQRNEIVLESHRVAMFLCRNMP